MQTTAKNQEPLSTLDDLVAQLQAETGSPVGAQLEAELLARCDAGLRRVASDYMCGDNFDDLLQIAREACLKLAREVPPAIPFFQRMMWAARQACMVHSVTSSGDVYIPERNNRGRARPTYTSKHEERAATEDPETLLMDAQTLAGLRRLVMRLPAPEREVLCWVYEIGRPKKALRALAVERRMSVSAVYALLVRGERLLSELVEEEGL